MPARPRAVPDKAVGEMSGMLLVSVQLLPDILGCLKTDLSPLAPQQSGHGWTCAPNSGALTTEQPPTPC